ncbi:MAG: hypothetical protein GF388_08915 [Candidatus Aegiribacteria sp.]|nr:hypothetical protein [Candidatus Aegiribacteria sp.]
MTKDFAFRILRQVSQAKKHIDEGEYCQCITQCMAIIRYTPDHDAAHRMLISCCLRLGFLHEALYRMVRLARFYPDEKRYKYGISRILGMITGKNISDETYYRITEIDPNQTLASLALLRGNGSEAENDDSCIDEERRILGIAGFYDNPDSISDEVGKIFSSNPASPVFWLSTGVQNTGR